VRAIGRAASVNWPSTARKDLTLADHALGDAYTILGVEPDSDDETIAAAYRVLARRHHPDVAGEAGTSLMMRVNAAFALIRTAELRTEYDRQQAASGARRPGWATEYDGTGGAGAPPGRPSGTVLDFGRHAGWSIGEIARVDPGYLVWLEDHRAGRPYLDEIDRTLRESGFRRPTDPRPERR
jgi:curved DNA-binding protein CbpA